jgi:hypothetical protein
MTNLAALAGDLGRSRLALLEVLARVPDDAWQPGAWGVRGNVAHVAAWDEAVARAIAAATDGNPLPTPIRDTEAFNTVAVAEFNQLSPVQVLVRLHMARARLVAAVSRAGAVGEFQYAGGARGMLAPLIAEVCDHERDHALEIALLIQ